MIPLPALEARIDFRRHEDYRLEALATRLTVSARINELGRYLLYAVTQLVDEAVLSEAREYIYDDLEYACRRGIYPVLKSIDRYKRKHGLQ